MPMATTTIEKEKEKGNVENEQKLRMEKLRQNLAKLKEAKKEQSTGFFRFDPGDTKILEFTGDMEAVLTKFLKKKENEPKEEYDKRLEEVEPKLMYAYKVIDTENRDANVQEWKVSRQWSDRIDPLLAKGFWILEIKRTGLDMATKYEITPYVEGAPAS